MPIGRTQDSDQFCDVFKSANGDFITGYSGHGVLLRRLLGVQLVSFNDHVEDRKSSCMTFLRFASQRLPIGRVHFCGSSTSRASATLRFPLSMGGNRRAKCRFVEAGLARPNEYRRDGARPRKIPNRLQLGRTEMRSRASPRGRPTKEEIK